MKLIKDGLQASLLHFTNGEAEALRGKTVYLRAHG